MERRTFGHTTVLVGERGGKYPHGNPLLVEGRSETVMIDPSLSVAALPADALPRADRVLNSHCHEDHVAGNHRYPAAPWHFHVADLPGIRSLDAMMAIYGYAPEIEAPFRKVVERDFHFMARPDAVGYEDGAVFDLGGATIRAVHAPGHTRGHCLLLIEPDGVLYLGDVDLSSFGPYYGDAWSCLDDFERTLAMVRMIEVPWYATFHHIGVVDRREFLDRLDRYAGVIARREQELLAYLAEPRTVDDVVKHRFVYRPGDPVPFADAVERRSMTQHLDRLVAAGRVDQPAPSTYRATSG